MSTRNVLSLALLLGATFASEAAFACRCVTPKTPEQAFVKADAVVLAEVARVDGNFEAEGGATATLKVSKAWKVDMPATLRVETRTTCAFDFRSGETYLVYLSRSGGRTKYTTTICDGNMPAGRAGSALEWLGRKNPASVSQ